MIPKTPQFDAVTQIDTTQVSQGLTLVGFRGSETGKPERVPLRAELRQAFEDSWKHNEVAYRYLGR